MTEIKALRKLRERGNVRFDEDSQDPRMMAFLLHPFELTELADEIEAEVAERFIELPSLDDGAILPGDWIESDYRDDEGGFICKRKVTAIIYDGYRWDFEFDDEPGDTRDCASVDDFYRSSKHTTPRTVEDILADFAADVENDRNTYDTARMYADEIRELLGADD